MSAPGSWRYDPFGGHSKGLTIVGPDTLRLTVDYDDVDHDAVEAWVPVIVAALNSVTPPVIVRTEEEE